MRRRGEDIRTQAKRTKDLIDGLSVSKHLSLGPSSLRKLHEELDAYARTDWSRVLEDVLSRKLFTLVHLDEAAFTEAQRLLTTTRLSRDDAVDAYILACVLQDASRLDSETPRVFMSSNRKEFSAGAGMDDKLPPDFYKPYRLLYQTHFHLATAVEQWDAVFA